MISTASTMTQKQQTDIEMFLDAARAMHPDQLMHCIHSHLEARPDLDGEDLERFADMIRRNAWARQRGEAT